MTVMQLSNADLQRDVLIHIHVRVSIKLVMSVDSEECSPQGVFRGGDLSWERLGKKPPKASVHNNSFRSTFRAVSASGVLGTL